MTAVAASAVDLSGVVGRILQQFRHVAERLAAECRGEPGTVRAASQAQAEQARQLQQVSQQARQRSTRLHGDWEGGAYDAYAARVAAACDKLDETATKLSTQSQKLGMAAAALDDATARQTALLADFDGKAAALVAQSRCVTPGAANAFIAAANRLGQSVVTAATEIHENLSRSLDAIAGNDPYKPESGDGPKYKLDGAVQNWLGKQDWFRKWYAEHGWSDDPTKPRFGALDLLGTDRLDAMMGKKEPTTAFGKFVDKTSGTVWKWDNDGKPLWEWGAGASGHASTALPGGGATGVNGSVYAGPQVTADGKLGWEGNRASLEGSVKATVLDAKGNAYVTYGPATAQASGEAYVGANADANLRLGLDGGSAHAGAFVGGKVEGSVAGDVGGVGAGLTGSLRYGLGLEGDAKATWENGHLQLGLHAGAAFGVGGSVGGSIDINLPKMWDSYEKLDPVGAQALRDGAAWVGNTASAASDAVGEAIGTLEHLGD